MFFPHCFRIVQRSNLYAICTLLNSSLGLSRCAVSPDDRATARALPPDAERASRSHLSHSPTCQLLLQGCHLSKMSERPPRINPLFPWLKRFCCRIPVSRL